MTTTQNAKDLCLRLEAMHEHWIRGHVTRPINPDGPEAATYIRRLEGALEWYAERVADCRKISAPGNVARSELDADGGIRARQALTDRGGDR